MSRNPRENGKDIAYLTPIHLVTLIFFRENNNMTYTEPGRGRKLCPECKVYVGVKSAKCEGCNHTFVKKEKLDINITPKIAKALADSEEGDGITSVGGLNNSVEEAKALRKQRKQARAEAGKAVTTVKNINLGTILTPSGKCPIPLEAFDKESVLSWNSELKTLYANRGEELSDEAVRYFVASFFPRERNTNYTETIRILKLNQKEELERKVAELKFTPQEEKFFENWGKNEVGGDVEL